MISFQGGVNYFQDGYDPASGGTDIENDTDEFRHYGQQVPQGMYGWGGYGGSVFLWDPKNEIGFAYVPTYLAWYDRQKLRGVRCLQALYKSLKQ